MSRRLHEYRASRCLLAACVLAVPSVQLAGGAVAITGSVVTARDSEPVLGVLVEIVLLESGELRSTLTTADGSFSFEDLDTGEYELTVYAHGFEPVAPIVVLPMAGQSSAVEVALTRVRSAGEKDWAVVRVLYATDRMVAPGVSPIDSPGAYYGGERGALSLGLCEVSVPREHRMGELESPSIFRFELRPDPSKHVVLRRIYPHSESRFLERLRTELEGKRSAFVFIHGYHTSFRDAARRTAQIHYDLGFPGVPIFYSWPSQGDLEDYVADTTAARWTVPDLTSFLTLLATEEKLDSIHLIAHSMGNQALGLALERLVSQEVVAPQHRFDQIALVAPDLDADTFHRDIAPRILGSAARISLYASSKDEALRASKLVSRYPRAGDMAGLGPLEGIDTIDVSDIDTSLVGHSYFGDNRSVITDLRKLLLGWTLPARQLVPVTAEGGPRYWKFVAAD